ncbi:MAG: hypothetical protein R3D02_17060, partial [Hyphomicrobiales bacterium]
ESERFHEILEALAQTYDRVVIDVGEMEEDSVASYISGLAGFCLLAARNTTNDPATSRAYQTLKAATRGEISVIRTEEAPVRRPAKPAGEAASVTNAAAAAAAKAAANAGGGFVKGTKAGRAAA